MTDDEYTRTAEGRDTISETCRNATRIVREQVEASSYLQADTQDARTQRYAMAFGALLAFVPDDEKAELVSLVRSGLSVKA